MENIWKRVLEYRVVLVRGTPACGKTTLLRLIQQHVAQNYPNFTYYTIDSWPQNLNFPQSEEHLTKQVGMSKFELRAASNILICIDDAQSSYYDDELWSFFKNQGKEGACFLLFCSYGSAGPFPAQVRTGTPPCFNPQQRISLQWETSTEREPAIGILLRHDEADDLMSRSCEDDPNRPQLASDLRNLLFVYSGGHAGALAGLVDTIITNRVRNIFIHGQVIKTKINPGSARDSSTKFD